MSTVSSLAYLGFDVSDLDAWERLASDVLGLQLAERRPDGTLGFRMDDRAQRIVVHPGGADDLLYAGFETGDEARLLALVEKLRSQDIDVQEAKPEVAATRRAERVFQLEDPSGLPIELVAGTADASEPFRSDTVPTGFVTGDGGLGHIVIRSSDPAASEHFYRELLGFRLSDRIHAKLSPEFTLDITFLHANPRHHTVAFAAAPMPKHIHHFMIEARSMDDVGFAFDRANAAGVKIAQGLGRHPNDRMFSFYAHTPSELQVEFGWGGLLVDDATWEETSYSETSTWGHKPPGAAAGG